MNIQDSDHIDRILNKYIKLKSVPQDTLSLLKSCFSVQTLRRNDYLVQEGQSHHHAYFLLQGAVRSFYLKDGSEINSWFAFGDEIIGSLQSYFGQPAPENIVALENSRLIAIHLSKIKQLADSDLHASQLVRRILEEYALYLEEKLIALQMNATERYQYLLQKEPQVLQRVPLTHIASYLGITRETLSRIRARKSPL